MLIIRDNSNMHGALGQFWITDGFESKRVSKDYIIPEGWYKGRKVPNVGPSLKKYYAQKLPTKKQKAYETAPKSCVICSAVLPYKKKKCKTCSSECLKVHQRNTFDPYKENSTRRTQVKADGITYDSKPELTFSELMKTHQIKCKKNYKTFSYINSLGETRKYRPDFYLEDHDLFIEIKGRFYYNVDVVNKLINFPHNIVFMFSNNFEDELYSFVCNLFVGRYKGPVSALATNQSLKP